MREQKPLSGAMILALYGVVAALKPIDALGRVYAAYDVIFIVLALAWRILVEGSRGPTGTTSSAPHHPCGSPGDDPATARLRVGEYNLA